MTEINIGSKIRELRKKKGITQEALAAVLTVTPQAVSKWESNLTYPDMAMIPAIARYFEVSLDVLFEYDVNEIKAGVEKIEKEARRYFYTDQKKYVEIIKEALNDYPGNEDFLFDLLNIFAGYDFTNIDGNDHTDEAIEIANRLISGSNNYPMICWAKERLAGIYLKKGEYDRAKALYESLPHKDDIPNRNESMAYMLSGKDKLDSSTWFRNGCIEDLYIACEKMGDSWFTMDQHPDVTFRDYTPDDYIPEAVNCYRKALEVLELFLHNERVGEEKYMWAGMQTFHWHFHQNLAACYKKLGQFEMCEKEVETAYLIVSTAWKDFEENRTRYMEPFNQHLKDIDLAEYCR